MANLVYLIFIGILSIKAEESELEFSDPRELLIAQESRQYQTVVKPPIRILKPNGITNSHRPQYNLDSFEADAEPTLRPVVKNYKNRNSEGMIRDAVLRALERKDHVGKFAQILPIVRAMSGNQRVALASLVASQVTTPPGRQPLNLSQVRSMFNNNDTAELMLPILLDTANLIRRSMRPGKEPREVKLPQTLIQRRSFTEDTLDDDIFEIGTQETTPQTIIQKYRNFRNRSQRVTLNATKLNELTQDIKNTNNTFVSSKKPKDMLNIGDDNKNLTRSSYSATEPTKPRFETISRQDNNTLDLVVEATNTTIVQDTPVAEKLRSLNRYVDRKGNIIRRGVYPKPSSASRRTTAEPTLSPIRRRPLPARTLAANEQTKCELFTNTLCLHSDDYPTEAIVQSIRRNKAAAGALLADFKEPDEGSIDGITAAQEAKYTADHYLVSNRRGDTSNRDFASAGEAGFMCPSTVKYARPQRARATSGQWKYIVNTGEHTQTLRLEKCLKPKEPCTYLTDNFKSKCVQVYNYHRLLTWDQQNGLHMDIFKVPTCCSCHIEGYSVSFPPLGHRMHETSSEHFPGEDIAQNQAFESVQPSIQRPSIKHPPFLNKPLEFPFNDNSIPDSFNKAKISDDEFNNIQNPMDSYGNTYFSDSFNQASSIRNVRRPLSRNPIGLSSDSVTLPSYLEPPTPSPSLLLSKDSVKYKIEQFKRRPNRRPIRKKISSGPEDLISSGSSSVAVINDNLEDDLDETIEESEISIHENFNPRVTIAPKLHAVTDKSLESQMKDDALKKVNYNYHPIIDFFDGDKSESIDREDNGQTYMTSETEWKPINRPTDKTTNSTSRKKHK